MDAVDMFSRANKNSVNGKERLYPLEWLPVEFLDDGLGGPSHQLNPSTPLPATLPCCCTEGIPLSLCFIEDIVSSLNFTLSFHSTEYVPMPPCSAKKVATKPRFVVYMAPPSVLTVAVSSLSGNLSHLLL